MERFYVTNVTGAPVHVRLDEMKESAKTFRLILSSKQVTGGRPLANFILVTKVPRHVPFLDGRDTKYKLDNRILATVENHLDGEGDYIFRITGFLN